MTPTIIFSHANGFPAGTYELLFDVWRAASWRVLALPKIGHDPRFPVTPHWPHLRDELIDFVTTQAPGESVHLVGHSLGGYLSLMAAMKRPAIVRSVVMVESPVVGGWRSHSVAVLKQLGLAKRLSPGRVSSQRRHQWPSVHAALDHFAAKPVFARWDPQVLRDYIRCGTEPDPGASASGAVRLVFQREVETRIYDTLPYRLGILAQRHKTRVPVSFIAATRSREARQAGLSATKALVGPRLIWLEGSHLVPMEQPLATATAVLEALATNRVPPPP